MNEFRERKYPKGGKNKINEKQKQKYTYRRSNAD